MPAHLNSYELFDFGDGRKLERFGAVVLDRPCPAAEGFAKSHPDSWPAATSTYVATRRAVSPRLPPSGAEGTWTPAAEKWSPPDWSYLHEGAAQFRLKLDALPSGQVGVFPEQADNWNWIANKIASHRTAGRVLRVLNLFAYTGGSTLAAAAAGAEVVHVDAARSIVERARMNAELSGLDDRPVRWIVEDALKFCRRELKRGNHYDAVILDPPSYGHGPKGEPWKIGDGLLPLLETCGKLTDEQRAFVLVTCHTSGIGPAELAAYLCDGIFGNCGQTPSSGELFLKTSDGRKLPSGVFARWPG